MGLLDRFTQRFVFCAVLDPVRMTVNHHRALLTPLCSSVDSVGDAIGGMSTWLAEVSLDEDGGLSDREGYRDVAWKGGRPPFLHPGGK